MANINQPFGFKPVRHAGGGEIRTNEYTIASLYNTAIYKGLVVQQTTDGSLIVAEAGNVDNIGVFDGVSYVDAQGRQQFSNYWPASTAATKIKAFVYDDPMIIFQVQSDATGAALVDVGNGADLVTTTGSTATGMAATVLDTANLATTGKTFRILRIVNDGVNVSGPYSVVEVLFNEHVLKGVVSGVGGI